MSNFNQSSRPGRRAPRSLAAALGSLILVTLAIGLPQLHAQRDWEIYQPFGSTLLWSVAYAADREEFVAVGPERQVAWDLNLSVLEDRTVESLSGAYSVVLNGASTVVGQILQEGIGHSGSRLSWQMVLPGQSYWGGVHGNGRFVLVGTGGRIATASDRLDDWSSVVVDDFGSNLYAVCFAEGRFLTGNEGSIWTSTDGSVWERSEGGFTGSARSIIYGRERYVMVGGGGSVRTSEDGLSWTTRESGTTASLRSVTFGDGIFVAVGDRGTIIYSIDRGESWVVADVGTAQQLNSIAFGDRMFHAVSSGGQVMASRSIMTPPALVVDLIDQDVLAGSNVILEVSASGTAPLSYAWSFQGATLEGATTSRISLTDVTEASEGRYQVTVINPAGAVTGRSALLNILPVDQPPEILAQPVSVAGIEGERIELSVEAAGSDPLVFRWYKGTRWLSDRDGPRLILDPAVSGDSGRYSVIVANGFGEVRSQEVVVSIEPEDLPPEILQQPVGADLVAGQVFELRVSARGWPPPGYQWFRNESELPGQNGPILRFAPVSVDDSGSYRIRLTNRLGSVESEPAVLSVVRPQVPPGIIDHPEDQALTTGDRLHLVAVAEGYPEPDLQWFRDEEPLTGATSRELQIDAVDPSDAGEYWLLASSSLGSVTSRRAVVAVASGLPRVLFGPVPEEVEFGSRLEISVVAVGPGPLSYRWFRDGLELPDWTDAQQVIMEVGFDDDGRYEVEVSNRFGAVRAEAFDITVLPGDFSGVWMGETGGETDSGRFALYVREDRSGVFLGLGDSGETARVDVLQVEADGAFELAGAAPPTSARVSGFRVGSGRFRTDTVAGVTPDGRSFQGSRSLAGTAERGWDGFFRAGLAGTGAGELLLIADGAGRYVLLLEVAGWVGGAAGLLDRTGHADLMLEKGRLQLQLDRGSRVLSGVWIPSGAEPVVLGGRADGEGGQGFLKNTSLRGVSGPDAAVMVTGFVLEGTVALPVLLRGIGPGLKSFGLSGALASARQTLHQGGRLVAESGPWQHSSAVDRIRAWGIRSGAFPLDPGSDDSALAMDLEPGAYTVHLVSPEGPGLGLTEIYLVPGSQPTVEDGHLSNLSTRMRLGPGAEVVIVGFVVSSEVPRRVLIRGVGPGLEPFGLTEVAEDPQLELFRDGTGISGNDDWDDPGGDEGVPEGLFEQVGAFPLAGGSRDAALVLWLEPGVYTAKVRGGKGESGLVLAEIYAVP